MDADRRFSGHLRGLAIMADTGMVNDKGVTWIWPVLPPIGMVAFGVIRLPGRRTAKS